MRVIKNAKTVIPSVEPTSSISISVGIGVGVMPKGVCVGLINFAVPEPNATLKNASMKPMIRNKITRVGGCSFFILRLFKV